MAEGDRSTLFSETDFGLTMIQYFLAPYVIPLNSVKTTRCCQKLDQNFRSIFIASHGRCCPPIPLWTWAVQQLNRLRNAGYSWFSGRADRKYQLVLQIKALCVLHQYRTWFYRCTYNFCYSMLTARESICCQELDNIRDLLIGDPVPACTIMHTDLLVQSCIFDCLSWATTPL